jgi:hypothetical protein
VKLEGEASNRAGAGSAARAVSSPIGKGDGPPASARPDWQKLIPEIEHARDAGGGRLPAVISAGLPKFDGTTTYGVLISNEGEIVPLQSSDRNPRYSNYPPAGHVEGKAAIWIREHGSTGGVVYHNNTDGTCGRCNSQLERLLPEDVRVWIVPPAEAVAKNRWARQALTDYVGDNALPKPAPRGWKHPKLPPQDPQPDFFSEQQP